MNWWRRLFSETRVDGAGLPVGEAPVVEAEPVPADAPPVNDAADFGVRIEQAAALPGAWYWRATRVHHLLPEENNGRHHIDVDVLQEVESSGGERSLRRQAGARVRIYWDGGEQILTIGGEPQEPGASLPLWRGQVAAVEVLGLPGARLPSDRVVAIHTGHPDEGPGNTRFRHSFAISFQSVRLPRPPTGARPIAHYVLFGPPEQPATQANLWLAQDYVLAFHPAFGFSAEEAAHASLVTIIADSTAIPSEVFEGLVNHGCVVERIAGSTADVTAALAERMARGEPAADQMG